MKLVMRVALCFLVSKCALAFDVEYEFGGTLEEHFSEVVSASGVSFEQVNDQLEFHTFDQLVPPSMAGYVYTRVLPRATQSWSISLDVTVPPGYESTDEDRVELGLGVGFNHDPSTGAGQFASVSLVADPNLPNSRIVEAYFSSPLGFQQLVTSNAISETVEVKLEYDAIKSLLSASHSDLVFYTADLRQVLQWGMGPDDRFEFFVMARTDGATVSPSEPLRADNFIGKIVPEPGYVAGMLATMLGIVVVRRTAS